SFLGIEDLAVPLYALTLHCNFESIERRGLTRKLILQSRTIYGRKHLTLRHSLSSHDTESDGATGHRKQRGTIRNYDRAISSDVSNKRAARDCRYADPLARDDQLGMQPGSADQCGNRKKHGDGTCGNEGVPPTSAQPGCGVQGYILPRCIP